MENYIGRECKGFRFEDEIDGISWITDMETHIGEIGVITKQYNTYVAIEFENSYSYFYPISLIEPHLVEEEVHENLNILKDFGSSDLELNIPFTYDGRSFILVKNESGKMYVRSAFSKEMMLIEFISDTQIYLFNYDLMGTRTTYEMAIKEIEFK
jgi:hypothetical protein